MLNSKGKSKCWRLAGYIVVGDHAIGQAIKRANDYLREKLKKKLKYVIKEGSRLKIQSRPEYICSEKKKRVRVVRVKSQ